MNPYRTMEVRSDKLPPKKGRPIYKTLYYKLLIWMYGTWRERYERCQHPGCLFFCKQPDIYNFGAEMLFHRMKHYKHSKRMDTER